MSEGGAVYEGLAGYYEWEHRGFLDDLHLYTGYAARAGDPVLDLGCGTGRLLVPMAEAGYQVTGVDSSADMLQLATPKLSRLRLDRQPRLVESDLRTMAPGEGYRFAFSALGSFGHLPSVSDQLLALSAIARVLVPRGLLVIDLVNPSLDWLNAGDGALVHQLTAGYPDDDGPDTLSKFAARTVDLAAQTEQTLIVYDRVGPGGALDRRTFTLANRLIFRYEAEHLLERTGFRLLDVHGDYDLSAHGPGSPRLILVAEKR